MVVSLGTELVVAYICRTLYPSRQLLLLELYYYTSFIKYLESVGEIEICYCS